MRNGGGGDRGGGWLRRFEELPDAAVIGVAVAMVVAVGAVDLLASYQLSFAVFYLIPVSLVAWYVGRTAGIVVSGLSAVTWLVADLADRTEPYVHALVPVWNASTRLAFFLVVAILLWALRQALDRERRLARTDALTGIANHRGFLELAERELARARRYHRPFTVAYVDIDDFKVLNDRFGHAAGDELLSEAVGVMASGLRTSDVMARLGGDEFAILMPETDPLSAEQVAARLHEALREAARTRKWPVTFSLGVLTCRAAPPTVNELVERADALMYQAKRSGKNRVEFGVMDPRASAIP